MDRSPPKELSFWVLFWIAAAVVGLWLITGFVLYDKVDATAMWGNRGTFGDMFGSVNALFSGLAFAGIIFTVLLQRQELQLQRKEIIASRDELAGQRMQLEAQSKTFILQRFEGTFFQMLQLHSQSLSAMDIRLNGGATVHGRDCFAYLHKRLNDELELFARSPGETAPEILATKAYEAFYQDWRNDLGHHFRSLYNLVKYVDKARLSGEDARFYTNLVRAQLADKEVTLLFYDGLSAYGRDKFKPLIEKYGLLKHLSPAAGVGVTAARLCRAEWYAPSAFGRDTHCREE